MARSIPVLALAARPSALRELGLLSMTKRSTRPAAFRGTLKHEALLGTLLHPPGPTCTWVSVQTLPLLSGNWHLLVPNENEKNRVNEKSLHCLAEQRCCTVNKQHKIECLLQTVVNTHGSSFPSS